MLFAVLSALVMGAPLLETGDVAQVSPVHILVTLSDDFSTRNEGEGWTIQATEGTDENYASREALLDVRILTRPRPAGMGETDAVATMTRALIELPYPLVDGAKYRLDYVPDIRPQTLSTEWIHAPTVRWTPAIQVNQLGYLPAGLSRRAYVSYWLADFAAMALDGNEQDFTVYEVIDGDGDIAVDSELALTSTNDPVVFEGTLRRRSDADANPGEPGRQGTDDRYGGHYSYASVYDVDLAAILDPGRYYIVWEGVGRSWPFTVDNDVYDDAYRAVFKALYLQRCGESLTAEHTAYVREPCHESITAETTSAEGFADDEGATAIVQNATGESVDIEAGGYHDGPDFGRHIEQLALVDDLIDLYELDPVRFGGRDLGVPQGEPGMPDIIRAALRAVTFFEGLQMTLAPNAGAIRGGVVPVEGLRNPERPASQDRREFYALAPSVRASYRFAAAAAKVSRVLLDFDADRADELREAAEKAFEWAHANRPPDRVIGDLSGDAGGMAADNSDSLGSVGGAGGAGGGASQTIFKAHWFDAQAAIELFKTTDDSQYDEYFIDYVPLQQGDDRIISVPLFADDDFALPLLAYMGANNAAPAQRAAVKAFLEDRVKLWLDAAEANAFRMVKKVYYGVGEGSFAVPRYAGLLFRYNELVRNDEALEFGIFSCDVSLGANPSG
ncbi:MAG: glycoside hydrolase family 9 protein, partial [Myxococcota bacterium]|nr:glycoside hydrolase family 9 protein [Myxococcota bacterium]